MPGLQLWRKLGSKIVIEANNEVAVVEVIALRTNHARVAIATTPGMTVTRHENWRGRPAEPGAPKGDG